MRFPTHVRGVSRIITFADPSPIGAVWQAAEAAGLLAFDTPCWAVYHRYSITGYTLTVGAASTADEVIPADQERVEVPEQPWHHVPTDGTIPGLQAAWQAIWQQANAGAIARSHFDVERWVRQAAGQTQADIYVGVTA